MGADVVVHPDIGVQVGVSAIPPTKVHALHALVYVVVAMVIGLPPELVGMAV